MKWTQEEEEILKREYATTSTRELAQKLNHSPFAIAMRASKLGLQKMRYKKYEAKIRELLQQNKTKKEIARELGVSETTLRSYIRKLQL